MLTLAIDCSARFCSVALHKGEGDRIIAEASPDIGRGHAEQLPSVLQTVLDAAGVTLSEVARVGVTTGPGSFAGIRVGVAFARGLALANSIPAVGVGSLEAIAVPATLAKAAPVMAALDARRDRVWALIAGADGEIITPGAEWTPVEAAAEARRTGAWLIGSGAALLAAEDESLAERVIGDVAAPAIADVARLASHLDPGANPPEPRYLRDADAKPQTGFALPHEVV
ncbi:tRNA (adenosine(37)-N6)-threonylcarbamoyltransferase complex dimerization subunit type 1 TsaB [Hoeflea sp. Naph1]|uniref:tRNA (adenosine(37)-N6)-threonylcarbamoyltransferase complex dimerization subunit type 1 TsaB n=1 Tax=Hoeflea sp. Naph1 TaxID=3388653 RepID=UPI0039902FEF